MKKLFLLSIALIGFAISSNAQSISENALGLRLGDSNGFGAEISYQRALGDNNRLELDLGWRDGNDEDGYKLTGLYQWVFPLDGDFNWYVGAGGGIADKINTFVFAAGNIGIEYSFEIPLLLSLDFRPEIDFGDDSPNNDDLDFDIALGIRYQF
ncbi:hypothetical protein [Snuella sedimenti]|uniref:Outer membrane protein beta-barrel domain-containing protein n=1 Tax=Snuella sedimenti TaxID=2798802 RepID=A0A8J7JCM8_9FLAO|nr:hypothetical protein [Snuella sedimenti]MBJ6368539.1 hypothetical protein [Snuella sedimenti]